MAFATSWLEKRALFPELFSESPENHTGIIVVIPAFDERGIAVLLNSLSACKEPECGVEIIIIVNAPKEAGADSLRNNSISIDSIKEWKKEHGNSFFRLYYFDAGKPSIPGWGAGLARKTGMDEALRRFNAIGNPDGVIVSLDADCTVEENYFTEISGKLLNKKNRNACSIRFEHPLSGNEFPEEIYRYAAMYELHMRYFYQAVRYSGYPWSFHTIGSAIAFRASAYLKAGGMNRKQAGEDFYFIQKLVPQGGYFELNSTTIYPSPRTSGRVPFGTGAVIARLIEGKTGGFLTYNPGAFRDLHLLFCCIEKLFYNDASGISVYYKSLPASMNSFISPEEWTLKISEIRSNTSGEESFVKRFFSWFNMFRIVKYLNQVHPAFFRKLPVQEAACEFLSVIGPQIKSKDPFDLLLQYRLIEKNS
ncbi:MAG: hypothetical protein MUF36_02025 [Bacteroidales bacterium]|jgi:hypothetical protein|nr:hypothetical protein [Bacteroidales bacterium]